MGQSEDLGSITYILYPDEKISTSKVALNSPSVASVPFPSVDIIIHLKIYWRILSPQLLLQIPSFPVYLLSD